MGPRLAVLPLPRTAIVETLRRRALTIPVSGMTAAALVPSFSEARGGGCTRHWT